MKPLTSEMTLQHVLTAWLKFVRIYHADSKEPTSNTFNCMHKLTSNYNTLSSMLMVYHSSTTNTHLSTHGMGLGKEWATIWWAVLSHSLLTANKSQVQLWMLTNPYKTVNLSQGIDAFCDDTALIETNMNDTPCTTEEMISTTQSNLNLWNGLLESSEEPCLNPEKCKWAHFHWQECNDLLTLTLETDDTSSSPITIHILANHTNH